VLGSAGKFVTHIAALQLVERSTISLDEPIYKYLPELKCLPLIRRGTSEEPFTISTPAKPITLRHLLLHTSGISSHSDAIIRDYFASGGAIPEHQEDAHVIVKKFSVPLSFEPGEGFAYGYSIYWTQLLITRLGGDFVKYMQDNIFTPLQMVSSDYRPHEKPGLWNRRLRMVERMGDKLVPTDTGSQGLACSMLDMGAILGDLISPSPRLLKQEHIDFLFTGQFAPSSEEMRDLLEFDGNYAFCAGKPGSTGPPSVNWSAAGLVIERELALSGIPKGSVVWEGMPNVLWVMNRERGLAMVFATQLIPVGDKVANDLALMFTRDAWNKFG
jgi:CubicO group peptidase (beta-lactamase class C family)